jgi:hypothetical protein
VAFLVSGSSGLFLRINVSLAGTKSKRKNYIMEGRKAKETKSMKQENTLMSLSNASLKLLEYIVELKIPKGELAEFKRDIIKKNTGLSYKHQIKCLRELTDCGLIQVLFYGNVREIAVNYGCFIRI